MKMDENLTGFKCSHEHGPEFVRSHVNVALGSFYIRIVNFKRASVSGLEGIFTAYLVAF